MSEDRIYRLLEELGSAVESMRLMYDDLDNYNDDQIRHENKNIKDLADELTQQITRSLGIPD